MKISLTAILTSTLISILTRYFLPISPDSIPYNFILLPLLLILLALITYLTLILISTYNIYTVKEEGLQLLHKPHLYLAWLGSASILILVS